MEGSASSRASLIPLFPFKAPPCFAFEFLFSSPRRFGLSGRGFFLGVGKWKLWFFLYVRRLSFSGRNGGTPSFPSGLLNCPVPPFPLPRSTSHGRERAPPPPHGMPVCAGRISSIAFWDRFLTLPLRIVPLFVCECTQHKLFPVSVPRDGLAHVGSNAHCFFEKSCLPSFALFCRPVRWTFFSLLGF